MLYAILAYHVEADVMSWTPEEDAALMGRLLKAHERVSRNSSLGPTARLGETGRALTLRSTRMSPFFANSFNPPACASACSTVIGPVITCEPGLATSPMT